MKFNKIILLLVGCILLFNSATGLQAGFAQAGETTSSATPAPTDDPIVPKPPISGTEEPAPTPPTAEPTQAPPELPTATEPATGAPTATQPAPTSPPSSPEPPIASPSPELPTQAPALPSPALPTSTAVPVTPTLDITPTVNSPVAAVPDVNTGSDQSGAPRRLYMPVVNRSLPGSGPGSSPVSPISDAPAEGWPMTAANLARNSWTPEEVKGALKPLWFRHFDAYISQKVQIIASNNTLFIATSQGLAALDAENGAQRWFYSTTLPLGNAPTIADGVAYVGGLDKQVHAIDIHTGQALWTFQGGAGFETNPLVVDGRVFLGGRDGVFYALNAANGSLSWKFATAGPILFSAAYKDGLLFFASNDQHAYALRAADGGLAWKSPTLPGRGFYSYWPVIYGDQVVFPGSYSYRFLQPFANPHTTLERVEAFPSGLSDGDPIGAIGAEPWHWASGTKTIQDSAAVKYFENNPDRRTTFLFNTASGKEYTYDSDGDGKAEYAPFLWFGTHSGTRYPPVVGSDGVLYMANSLFYNQYIPRGRISGWKIGTPFVSVPKGSDTASDEPIAYAVGGNTIYWKRCCDRMAGAFEIAGAAAADLQSWTYYDEGGNLLRRYLPDLFDEGWDFAYWKHGDQSPPIPYHGKVYLIANNAVVAFSPNGHGKSLNSELPTGSYSGEKSGDIRRSETFAGANVQVTLSGSAWPLIIQQESYYSTDNNTNAAGRWFRLAEVAGSGSAQPGSLAQQSNPTTTLLTQTWSGHSLKTRVSARTPTTLFENTNSAYQLNGSFTGLAYRTAAGVKVITGSATISGSELAEGWLLAWDGSGSHRWSPLVLSLQHRPSEISFSGSAIKLTFGGAAGYLGVTPLVGMSAPKTAEAGAWPGGIPSGAIDRVRLLDRLARAFPDSVQESRAINGSDVSLTYQYSYIQYPGDWNTSPRLAAYLPPSLGLAAWGSSPIRINGQPLSSLLDLNFVTPLGRLAAAPDTSKATVSLPGLASAWRSPSSPPGSWASGDPLRERLAAEVTRMVDAGHLLPGYGMVGIWESKADMRIGDFLGDYWHNPSDTVYTLLQALPWLPGDLQNRVRTYLQNEFKNYPLYSTAHVGWDTGASRNSFIIPSEVLAAGDSFTKRSTTDFNGWGLPPQNLYALWMYAAQFGDAANLFSKGQPKLDADPQYEASVPYVLNAYISGYIGYLRLAALAGAGAQTAAEDKLIEMLIMRAALSKYPNALAAAGFEYGGYSWALRCFAPEDSETLFTLAISGSNWSQMPLYGFPIDPTYNRSGAGTGGDYAFGIDFVNLTPELAAFLSSYAKNETAESVAAYTQRAPLWFVAEAAETGGEGVLQPMYDRAAYFQARALILSAPRGELERYLDAPAAPTGDLFFIQNLVFALRAGG